MYKLITEAIAGSRNEREIKKLRKQVPDINRYCDSYRELSDDELQAKTEEFTRRLAEGEDELELLPEAFGAVKEQARRCMGKSFLVTGSELEWDMVHYDVQLVGGVALFKGKITEMATGEGKTLVATLPMYLMALTGRAAGINGDERFIVRDEEGNVSFRGICHLVTVNDYLARRDREWMGPIFEGLGLTVGVIQGGMEPGERRVQYNRDITYGTNSEFGFDYLRDHMAFTKEDKVQRGHHYAIIDEVDSILIDEARTPLIISGPAEHSNVEQYREMNPVVSDMSARQNRIINGFLTEAQTILDKEETTREENGLAGIRLLQSKRGAPKNKRLFKLLQMPGVMKLVDKTELKLMKDKKLRDYDAELYYTIDEKGHAVDVTEMGRDLVGKRYGDLFTVPDLSTELSAIESDTDADPSERFARKEALFREYSSKTDRIHAVQQLLKGYSLYEKEIEYVVSDGRVVIVDQFTGRMMPGRRWSDGLHEAVEAKEGVKVQQETQTLATITIQNYFRMYDRLAGMTGTAMTEAGEFWEIYKLDVVAIPTNRPIRRVDLSDIIFKTKKEKYQHVVEEVERQHKLGRPVLMGTTSIEESELIARLLKLKGVPHNVLNARHHEREAQIIRNAGQAGAVTISTNMAGRGTDIKLGEGTIPPDFFVSGRGEEGPKKKDVLRLVNEDKPCGLMVLGTQRHESRRVDNQLRGRSGRQGDPGVSRFFLSLEDNLLRLFGSDRVMEIMEKWGKKDEGPIESKMVTKALENAQKRVEHQHFQVRKRLLEYDDVINRQREVVYGLRDDAIEGRDLHDLIFEEYVPRIVEEKLHEYVTGRENIETRDPKGLAVELGWYFATDFGFLDDPELSADPEKMWERIKEHIDGVFAHKEEQFGEEKARETERIMLLSTLDGAWREHLYALDHLKEGVFLRQYAQKDPLVEFKKEAFAMFDDLMARIAYETVQKLFRVQRAPEAPRRRPRPKVTEIKERIIDGGGQVSAGISAAASSIPRGVTVLRGDGGAGGKGKKKR